MEAAVAAAAFDGVGFFDGAAVDDDEEADDDDDDDVVVAEEEAGAVRFSFSICLACNLGDSKQASKHKRLYHQLGAVLTLVQRNTRKRVLFETP